MVYQIFSDGLDRKLSLDEEQARRRQRNLSEHQQQINGLAPATAGPSLAAFYANLLIILIKLLLFIYDALSLPIYYVLQRPDKRFREASQPRSYQVDANTWVRANFKPSEQIQAKRNKVNQLKWRYMGATVSEIFANAVREHNSNSCLGYRALVTCPVITLDEHGQHVFRDQSFRSDFTWYTYGQIGRRVHDLASGLYQNAVYPSGRAMFLASSCLEWFCMAHACFQLSVQLVLWPELNTNDLTTLHSIVFQAQVESLFVSCDQLGLLCQYLEFSQANGASHLKRIVIIDWQFAVDFNEPLFLELGNTLRSSAKRRSSKTSSIEVLSIGQIEEAGIENPIELRCSRALSGENLNLPMSLPNVTKLEPLVRINHTHHEETTPQASELSSMSEDANRESGDIEAQPSRWLVGAEPIDTSTTTTTCSSAPMIRRRRQQQLSNQESKCIYGNNDKQLEANLLNAYSSSSSTYTSPAQQPQQTVTFSSRPEHLALIVYTHGALGQLKALMLTHGQLARCNQQLFLDGLVGPGDVHCAVLPLDCIIELMTELCVFSHGGSIGYSNNLKTLFHGGKELFERDKSDLETAQPTHLLVRPYILEQLRASLQDYLQLQLNPIMSFIFKNVLYEYKKQWAKRHFDTPLVDRLFCARLKRFFGSRLEHILCNGTTDCSETKDFFAFMVNLPVIELYGPDEAIVSMISSSNYLDPDQSQQEGDKKRASLYNHEELNSTSVEAKQRSIEYEDENSYDFCDMQLMPPRFSTNTYRENFCKNILITTSIFSPTSNTRIRLEDWEEFRLSDLPYPRGRLVIGGDAVCAGYLDTHQQQPFSRDSNGINWFQTGDIARAFPNGSFEIISAISNIIKMVDGQFVSLSQIEHILRNSQFVDNVCALCGGDRTFVINLVVPNLRRIALKSPNEANLKMAIGMEPEPDELSDVEFRREVCNDRLLCEFVTDHLSKLLAQSGLGSITNRFLLVPEIWTPQSELVTLAYEPKRQAVQKFYANDIQSMVRMQARKGSRRLSDNRRTRHMI